VTIYLNVVHNGVIGEPADVYDQLYAVRKLLDGQWALAVLCALTNGPKRYGEIFEKVQEYHITDTWSNDHKILHQSSLSRILDVLTRDELLMRDEKPRSFPPSVTYSLTEPAITMLEAASPLVEWVNEHTELIARAQKWRRG
jgi:DNA-binding HxlR family transcriptional regulator